MSIELLSNVAHTLSILCRFCIGEEIGQVAEEGTFHVIMDGQYPPHMPPLGVFYPNGFPPAMPPPETFHQSGVHQIGTMSMENLGSYPQYEDPNRNALPPPAPQRSRRRQPPGSEHVKHRRTRSGCYTCRQRRVKVRLTLESHKDVTLTDVVVR